MFTAHSAVTDIWRPVTIICWDYRIITRSVAAGDIQDWTLSLVAALGVQGKVVHESRWL